VTPGAHQPEIPLENFAESAAYQALRSSGGTPPTVRHTARRLFEPLPAPLKGLALVIRTNFPVGRAAGRVELPPDSE